MNSHTITNRLVSAVGALAVAGAALIAAPAASASGTLSITPEAGSGESAISVTTTAGCGSVDATHYVIKLSGKALKEEITMNGVQPLASIPALGSGTSPISVPVAYTFEMAQEAYGSVIPTGVYDLNFICRSATDLKPITVFSGKVTIEQLNTGIAFTAGAKNLPVTVASAPKVSGKAKVGSTLKVSQGTWSPKPDTVKATWKIGQRTVGTGFSYKVKPGDRGKTITVTVTASKKGYVAAAWVRNLKVAK